MMLRGSIGALQVARDQRDLSVHSTINLVAMRTTYYTLHRSLTQHSLLLLLILAMDHPTYIPG
jgi:hypothetical protein